VKVLDGEKAYNNANLDQYLMGITKINVIKKEPKKLASMKDVPIKNRLTKADESFYQHYGEMSRTQQEKQGENEKLSPSGSGKDIKISKAKFNELANKAHRNALADI
jgi:hypothetical protein